MTNRIIIGTEDHVLNEIDESWIAQQIVPKGALFGSHPVICLHPPYN